MRFRIKTVRTRHDRLIVTAEAAVVTLLVCTALYFLTGYQQERLIGTNPNTSELTLLNLDTLSAQQQERIRLFCAMHDPRLIARADTQHSFSALWRETELRDYRGRHPADRPELPERRASAFLPLTPLKQQNPKLEGFVNAPVRSPENTDSIHPRIIDNDGNICFAEYLRDIELPLHGHGTTSPTILRRRGRDGRIWLSVAESCGIASLDEAALNALAGVAHRKDFPERVFIYWPEQPVNAKGDKRS